MNETVLLLKLLTLERESWELGREQENSEVDDISNKLATLILEIIGFPKDLTDEESDDLYNAFDEGYNVKLMLAWLSGERARLRCLRELDSYPEPEAAGSAANGKGQVGFDASCSPEEVPDVKGSERQGIF